MENTAANSSTGECAATRRLPRSRSAEDLSREQLKTTADATVLIFLEYVRKKLSKTSPTAAEVDEAIERERRQRREGRTKQASLRRLQSEPHSPAKNGGGRDGEMPQRPDGERDAVAGDGAAECPSSRPHRLVLDRPPSNKDERRHRLTAAKASKKTSNSNSSSTATTPSCAAGESSAGPSPTAATPVPIPDPPLCSALAGPSCDARADFVSSYPPPSAHRVRAASSPVIGPVPPVIVGVPTSQYHYCTSQQPLTPQITRSATSRDPNWNRKKQARIIANRLKIFGDEISSTHEAEIQREFARLITTHSPQEVIAAFSSQLRHMLLGLSWQNIGKVFHLSYHLLEFLTALLGPSVEDTGRPEWREFSELWDLTLSSVTRWISINGGWGAFPADTSTVPSASSEQATCPATPSFRRARSHLMSLSESGEFEFFNEEGHPRSADTVSTTSSEIGWSEDDRMGSSVDLQHDRLECESTSESSLTTSPPNSLAPLTPVTVPPPCAPPTTPHHTDTNPSPKRNKKCSKPKRHLKESQSVPSCASSSSSSRRTSTVAFQNGIPQLTPTQSSQPKKPQQRRRKSRSVTERPATNCAVSHDSSSDVEGQGSCREKLGTNGVQDGKNVQDRQNADQVDDAAQDDSRSGHRTSTSTINGLVFGGAAVGGAAVVYAAVSALMRR